MTAGRVYDRQKVMRFILDNPQHEGLSDGQFAALLKRNGLMAPTTYYHDTGMVRLRRELSKSHTCPACGGSVQ